MKEEMIMKYYEFQKAVKQLGYRTEFDNICSGNQDSSHNLILILNNDSPDVVAKISEFDSSPEIDGNIAQSLMNLIKDFATTPVNERGL